MRKRFPSFSSLSFSNDDTTTLPITDTAYDSANPISTPLPASSSFISCRFISLSCSQSGGALAFTAGGENSVIECIFSRCSSTLSFGNCYGGGAVFSNSGSLLSVSSSKFISCSTQSIGGGLLCTSDCESSSVSECFFFGCSAETCAGGMSTHYGPRGSVSSSSFVLCTSKWTGGGIYHNSLFDRSHVSISNSLFKENNAKSIVDHTPGGGGFGDFRENTYTSKYSFLFFTGNIAPINTAYDIFIRDNPITLDCIKHCFTTTTSTQSFYNNGQYQFNWLPLTTVSLSLSNNKQIYARISSSFTFIFILR